MKRFVILGWTTALATMLLMAPLHAQDSQGALRVWKSRDGQHEIRAAFSRYDASSRTVYLESESGDTISVSIDQLSTHDKGYVASYLEKPVTIRPSTKVASDVDAGEADRVTASNESGDQVNSMSRYGVNWIPELSQACQLASGNAGLSDDRPVMMFRVLGDLNGFM